MSRAIRHACPLCGTMVVDAKRHAGRGPCRATQAALQVAAKMLVPLRGTVDASLRYALEQFGVPHEVSPVVFNAEMRMRRGQFGMQWHSSQKNALCVPAWVEALVLEGATFKLHPLDVVRRAMSLGEEFRNALATTAALGGTRAVTQYLYDTGFYNAD